MPRTPYSQGPCANCGAHRLLKYAHRTMCCRYKCQRAAAAQRQARLAGGGADDAVVPTFCYKIEAVLGMRFCDPDQLIGKKRRNRLAAADNTICYLTRGTFKEDQQPGAAKSSSTFGVPAAASPVAAPFNFGSAVASALARPLKLLCRTAAPAQVRGPSDSSVGCKRASPSGFKPNRV